MTELNKRDIINKLIEKNVSVNAMDKFNRNPLFYAADKGYFEIIKCLIDNNCDPHRVDNLGNTHIHLI